MNIEEIKWGDLTIVINNCNNNYVAEIKQHVNIRVKATEREQALKQIKELFIYMLSNRLI
jgi:hypothetical protein